MPKDTLMILESVESHPEVLAQSYQTSRGLGEAGRNVTSRCIQHTKISIIFFYFNFRLFCFGFVFLFSPNCTVSLLCTGSEFPQ